MVQQRQHSEWFAPSEFPRKGMLNVDWSISSNHVAWLSTASRPADGCSISSVRHIAQGGSPLCPVIAYRSFRVCEGELIRFLAVSCVPTNCTAITGKSKIIVPWRIDVEHYSLNNFQVLSEKASRSPVSHLFSSSIFFSLSSFSVYSVRLKVKMVNDFVHVVRSIFLRC